jgi:hypothetical protein
MKLAFLVAAVLIGADEKKKPHFATVEAGIAVAERGLPRGDTMKVTEPPTGGPR